ncbi:uncharacterized protein LOC131890716 [Tigriopus californicus]|nr:uncharacterized protein LOC131890716 [Tigriopus californicus]
MSGHPPAFPTTGSSGHQSPRYGAVTPNRGDTVRSRNGESPARQHGSLDRRSRRNSGNTQLHPSGMGSSRLSPGPSIYRTMPLTQSSSSGKIAPGRQTPGRNTPSHLVRPIPQNASHGGGHHPQIPGHRGMSPFSPVMVPKINQSPAMSPVPFSPITVPRQQLPFYDYHPSVQHMSTSSVSPAVAEIVANQSQDYIDEQLAEFQTQIQILQGKA